jgi:hypothetical protein
VSQPDLEALQAELRELTRRVADLERHLGFHEPSPWPAALAAPPSEKPRTETAVLVAIIGRAFLGLAGAYLLRALTEAGTLPARVGIAAGIAYAIAWQVWAARTPVERRLEAAIHSLTAALVLSPLLWEATLHFHAVGTWTAASVLLIFTVSGMAVAWRKSLVIVSTISTLASLGTAAGLLVATHDVLPFTFLFLAAAEAVEVSACLEHWLSERWVAAAAADLSVLLATWLVTNERGLPEAYAPIPHTWLLAAQVALLAIYLSSTIVRTLFCGFTFTTFEMMQCAAAFAIGVSGGLRLSNADHRAAPAMALLMLCCAAACYVVSFLLLERRGSHGRNFYTYSTFGLLLALAGSRILLSGNAAVVVWAALALGCFAVGAFRENRMLQFHGGAYLLLALAWAGTFQQAASLLFGSSQWPIHQPAVLWLGAAMAAFGYALSRRAVMPFRLALAAVFCTLAGGILAGLLTGAYHWWFGASATHAYCATLRTAVLAGSSVALAWCGSRWSRPELSRLIYPAMLLGAYRLVAEDLHQDRKVALFFSLLVYGAALILLPKLKAPAPQQEGRF